MTSVVEANWHLFFVLMYVECLHPPNPWIFLLIKLFYIFMSHCCCCFRVLLLNQCYFSMGFFVLVKSISLAHNAESGLF